ncbi:exoribonuclease II [Gallaecimonas sp. GXIMD4217]|uniref:exoribonuclease II n=1 Tax=Gallaecimonas sp. GXIMD4217 TaxID=3131927 RepID=UPI00311AE018
MFKDNPLLAQLKAEIRETLTIVEGTIKSTDKKFGFLEAEGGESYFVPPPFMRNVIHGDKIKAVVRTVNDKEQAEPESLIEPFLTRFVGRIRERDEGRLAVVADHPKIKQGISCRVARGKKFKLAQGDWVVAELKRHPLKGDKGFYAEVIEHVAAADDHYAPWHVTLARHNLHNQAPTLDGELHLDDAGLARADLTALPLVTIDSASTKDMDDALLAEKTDDGFKLTVAIADPTAYVPADSELDKAAAARAFTVYLPGRNVTMLPEKLSDELCSLMPNEQRPALVAELHFAADGTPKGEASFQLAMVESKHKLAYNDLSDYLEGVEGAWQPGDQALAEHIQVLHELTQARVDWRSKHALVFGDRPDYRFELNEAGEVVTVHVEPRRIANRIVEEAMIAANMACGQFLREHLGAGVFNVHLGFEEEKLADAVALLEEHGAPVAAENLNTLGGFSELRRWLEANDQGYLDSRLRRYQGYAVMTHEPGPHFGLGLDAYATWTSPIRKYGDMVNHRLIKGILSGNQHALPQGDLLEHLSDLRRLNRLAERDVGDWLYVRWLGQHVDQDLAFDAEIIDVNRGGLKVRLVDNGAVAFVPAKTLHDTKDELDCNYDTGIVSIKGQPSYRLADTVKVKLIEAVEETRNLVAKPVA